MRSNSSASLATLFDVQQSGARVVISSLILENGGHRGAARLEFPFVPFLSSIPSYSCMLAAYHFSRFSTGIDFPTLYSGLSLDFLASLDINIISNLGILSTKIPLTDVLLPTLSLKTAHLDTANLRNDCTSRLAARSIDRDVYCTPAAG